MTAVSPSVVLRQERGVDLAGWCIGQSFPSACAQVHLTADAASGMPAHTTAGAAASTEI